MTGAANVKVDSGLEMHADGIDMTHEMIELRKQSTAARARAPSLDASKQTHVQAVTDTAAPIPVPPRRRLQAGGHFKLWPSTRPPPSPSTDSDSESESHTGARIRRDVPVPVDSTDPDVASEAESQCTSPTSGVQVLVASTSAGTNECSCSCSPSSPSRDDDASESSLTSIRVASLNDSDVSASDHGHHGTQAVIDLEPETQRSELEGNHNGSGSRPGVESRVDVPVGGDSARDMPLSPDEALESGIVVDSDTNMKM